MTSLSPLHTIGDQVSEALRLHADLGRKEPRRTAIDMLTLIGFPDPATRLRHLSLRAVGRPAAAGDDRHGADLPTGAADRRRAVDRARRHHPGADPQADPGPAQRAGHGAAADHPRPRRRRQHRRGGGGDVPRPGDGERHARGPLRRSASSLPEGAARRRAALRHEAGRAAEAAARDPARHRAPAGSAGATSAAGAAANTPLLEVSGLSKSFRRRKRGGLFGADDGGETKVVDDVSFRIERGSCFGLVGESGCGKTTVSKIILRAIEPDAGRVIFDDGNSLSIC